MPTPDSGILRTFVALPIAPSVREGLAREIERLERADPSLRATRPENLHVTLVFLGPTPADDVARISAALEDAARGVAPIAVRYEGLGAFPNASHPRVVWAGLVETGSSGGRLALLAGRVAERLTTLGYRLDDREFHAHVTLARSEARRPEAALRKVLTSAHLQDTNMAEVLSDLELMVSEPGGGGTRYRPLSSASLVPTDAPPTDAT